jgi:hypothetical protein
VSTITIKAMETTTEFKAILRILRNSLRGKTLQIVSATSVRPYSSLKDFGNAILAEEQAGRSLSITQAWSNEGIIKITSLHQLAQLLITTTITAIQFKSQFNHNTFESSLRYDFGTTE